MIFIVTLCAVLLAARGVTMWWMAEAAWEWSHRPASRAAPPPPPSIPIAAQAPIDPPPAPADAATRPVARPLGSPAMAFTRDAYPPEALRGDEQGRVVARLATDVGGRPTGCSVVTSSRSVSLDRTTCAIGAARLRFDPARDARGAAVAGRYDLSVRWSLED